MKKLIALLLIISTPAYADQAITVHTGDTVTKQFDQGTLLDKPKADKVKNELIDGDACKKENGGYQQEIQLYQNNEKLYQDENTALLNSNTNLTKSLNDSKSMSDWEKAGFFLLGVAVTGLAVYGASKVVQRH